MMNFEHWVNLKDYTPFGLITFGLGCFGWLIVYVLVIRDMVKFHRLEISIAAICSNFAWKIIRPFFYVAFFVIDLAFIYIVTTSEKREIAPIKVI
jgi:hypothetical protein